MGLFKQMKDMKRTVEAAPGMIAQAQQLSAQAQQLAAAQQAAYGAPAGYGAPAAAGDSARYGAPAGYGVSAGYGAPAGAGVSAGYGAQAGAGVSARYGAQVGAGDSAATMPTAPLAAASAAPGSLAGPAAADPDLEPIAGVSIELYAEISRECAGHPGDAGHAALVAAGRGVAGERWQTAMDGWNSRMRNPAVARRFNQLYMQRG